MESTFGRLWSVLISPSKTFESIRERPSWLIALVAILVIGLLGTALINPKIDYAEMIEDSMEAQGREVPEDQMEGIIDFYEKFGPVMGIAGSFIPVIGYLLIAVLFLVVFVLLGSEWVKNIYFSHLFPT